MALSRVAVSWSRFSIGAFTAWATLVGCSPGSAEAQATRPVFQPLPAPSAPSDSPRGIAPAPPIAGATTAVPTPQAPITAPQQTFETPAPLAPPAPAYNTYPQQAPVPSEAPAVAGPPGTDLGHYGAPPRYRVSERPLSRPPGPGSHEHEGFFLRITAGAGVAGLGYDERFDGQRVSHVKTLGLAGSLEVALGGRVVGNFIVHGNLGVVGADSRRTIDDVKDSSYHSINTTLLLLGAGGTYYFMPSNLYLTLVLGTCGMIEHRDYGGVPKTQAEVHSKAGFAGSLSIGKEWWVGGRGDWGIGAAIMGALYAAPIDLAGVHSLALGHSVTVAFSATLN